MIFSFHHRNSDGTIWDCPDELEVKEVKVLRMLLIAVMAAALLLSVGLPAAAGECDPHWDISLGQPGADGWLYWLATREDPSTGQPAVYAGGLYTSIGGVSATGIARWDGTNWSAMGAGLNDRTFAIEVFDDGTGPAVYAGGNFTASGSTPISHIAKFNASTQQWEQVGAGFDDAVIALAVWDDGAGGGPALYAGGLFIGSGSTSTRRVARWDGKQWSGVGNGMDGGVRAFAVYDDGTGPHLYAGGLFNTAGGAAASRIAKWTGTNWVALGSGLTATTSQGIRTMAVYDDGNGPALYVGGSFQGAGGQPANNVARWKDNTWSALGSGVNERLVNMTTFDDKSGVGPRLYCGGWFTAAGGAPVSHVATWDGQAWSPLGAGTNTVVRAFTPWTPPGEARRLFVGGGFTQAAGQPALHIAAWEGCSDPVDVPGDVDGDGSVTVQDLLAVINGMGPCPAAPATCPADIAPPPSGDGNVDVSDLLMVIVNWR